MLIRRLAVIGVGLIGGSLARTLREAGEVGEVVGCGRSKANLDRAVDLGVIHRYSHDVAVAVQGADMIFVAVPLGAMRETFEKMVGHLAADAVITDGGSAKASVIADALAAFGELPAGFVPGHPIAGTENSGVEASFAELYRDRRIILTPTSQSSEIAIQKVTQMWRLCGAEVTSMDVEHHDEVLAATSHLPHMLAFSLVDTLASLKENDEIFRYAAGGFRDFTRIASSNPVMWRDICIANRKALGKVFHEFSQNIAQLAETIEQGDDAQLLEIFQRAKATRDRYVDGVLKSTE